MRIPRNLASRVEPLLRETLLTAALFGKAVGGPA